MYVKITVFTDDPVLIKQIDSNVKETITEQGGGVHVSLITSESRRVVSHLFKHNIVTDEASLYLIDVTVKKQYDGIDLARTIRKFDPLAYIVFLSDNDICKKYIDYEIRCFDFFFKPIGKTEFIKLISKIDGDYALIANTFMGAYSRRISVVSNYKNLNIPIKDIIAFEHNKPKTKIYMKGGIVDIYSSLAEIENKLENSFGELYHGFIKIHKAIIVNLQFVRKVDIKNCCVEMSNGEIFVMARSRRYEVKEEFEKYYEDLND